jgi:hypothetical protein
MRGPSNMHGTRVAGATTITKDIALALKGKVQRCLEALCATLISHDAFKHQATSPMRRQNQPSVWLEDYCVACRVAHEKSKKKTNTGRRKKRGAPAIITTPLRLHKEGCKRPTVEPLMIETLRPGGFGLESFHLIAC